MKTKTAQNFITKELTDLDVPKDSKAWSTVFDTAIEASEIMTKKELKKYIEDYVHSLPNDFFFSTMTFEKFAIVEFEKGVR